MIKEDLLLTISIPTYNRADKLARLLEILNDELKSFEYKNLIGIYISNNASTDNTKNIITKYSEKFKISKIDFSYINQPINIGMGGNFIYTFENPKSNYIWWFSDDDILIPGFIPKIVSILKNEKPNVFNMGFLQPPYTNENSRYTKNDLGFKEDKTLYANNLSTKLSAIIVNKNISLNVAYSKINASYWSHVYIVLDIILNHGGYYIYPENVVKCDDEFMNIRYEPDAIVELKQVVFEMYDMYSIDKLKITNIRKLDSILLNLQFLRLHYCNKIILEKTNINSMKKKLVYALLFKFKIFIPKYLKGVLSFIFHLIFKRR